MNTIDRRGFLELGLGASLSPILSGCHTVSTGLDFPEWAVRTMDNVESRFRAWGGSDETISFVYMTDVHSMLLERPAAPDFADSRYHVLLAQELADRLDCDFIVDCGDHDFENDRPTDDEAFRRMAVSQSFYADYASRPVLFCLGNHDHGRWHKSPNWHPTISSDQFGETFNGLSGRHGFELVFGPDRSQCWHDVPARRFRALVVNTSDSGYSGLSDAQLAFVERAFGTLPAGWTIAVFGHICVRDEIGHWKCDQPTKGIRGKVAFVKILEAFVHERPNALVGYFCGDSHFDNAFEQNGVNYTISQGFGGCLACNVPWGARRAPDFDCNVPGTFLSNTLFELVGVKPSRGEFRLFRVGAGGADFDRGALYANRPDCIRGGEC